LYREIKYKKSDIIKVCDHMNEKMNSYKTRMFLPLQSIVGLLLMFFFIVSVFHNLLFSLIFLFSSALFLANSFFTKIKIDNEAIKLKVNPFITNMYFYEDIKKLKIKGRRLKIKGDFLTPDYILLSNPEKIKEGIKRYRPELLE